MRKRRELSFFWQAVLAVPLAGAALFVALYIEPCSIRGAVAALLRTPVLLLLNYLPFLLLTAGFGLLFGNVFFGAAAAGGLGGVLSLVSRTMIEKRDEPLTPKDFALLREAGDALKSYDLSLNVPSLVMLAGFLVLTVALGVLLRGGKAKLFARLAGFLCAVGLLSGLVKLGPYSDKELYNSMPAGNFSYITSVYNDLGFPYCFLYNFNTYLIEMPEGFDAEEAASYAARYPESRAGAIPVNVVIVMNEAFSDITNLPAFDYAPGEEPLRFYNSLSDHPRAVTGHILVPNTGAGTANTEFDVLTGMQTNLIAKGGTSAFRVLNRETDSLFRIFREEGYLTEFIHPGHDWFYNRQNVYRYLGAEKLMFEEGFEGAEQKGSWFTDRAVLSVMQEEFEAATAEGGLWFNFTTTIQNHQAYTADKYGALAVPPVPLKVPLADEEAKTMLSVYAEGVRDADAMLRELTEYFDSREEPVVLLFFGDHLPNLGDNFAAYRALGIPIGEGESIATTLFTYETPYVLWVNEAAAEVCDVHALTLPDDNTVNANYLGAILLELTGREKADSYFAFLSALRQKLPLYRNGVGRTGAGEYFDALPAAYEEDLRMLRFWEYYKLKYE